MEEENYFFRVTEAIFVGWFTLEYLIRFIVSPYKVGCSFFFINIVSKISFRLAVRVCCFISQYYRPSRNSSILRVCLPEPAFFPIFPRIHSEGSSDFSHPPNIKNFQTFATHHRAQDAWNHSEKQPQVGGVL